MGATDRSVAADGYGVTDLLAHSLTPLEHLQTKVKLRNHNICSNMPTSNSRTMTTLLVWPATWLQMCFFTLGKWTGEENSRTLVTRQDPEEHQVLT